jgi:hypothetical protein
VKNVEFRLGILRWKIQISCVFKRAAVNWKLVWTYDYAGKLETTFYQRMLTGTDIYMYAVVCWYCLTKRLSLKKSYMYITLLYILLVERICVATSLQMILKHTIFFTVSSTWPIAFAEWCG